jgi:hypothetical protein
MDARSIKPEIAAIYKGYPQNIEIFFSLDD